MHNPTNETGSHAVIRLGRLGRLSWGIALAASLAVGLNGFVLVGWVTGQADASAPTAYLLFMVLSLPLALTYAERAMAARGTGGSDLFGLLRADSSDLRAFAGGWLLLLGYLCLAALLIRGLGLHVGVLAHTWFGLAFDVRWLAVPLVLLAALVTLRDRAGIGPWRAGLVWLALALALVLAGWAWLQPATGVRSTGMPEPSLWNVVAFLAPGLWSVELLLGYRRQMRQPRKAWFPALLTPLVVGALLGACALATRNYPHLLGTGLNDVARLAGSLASPFLESVFVAMGLAVSFVAVVGVLKGCLHLVEEMTASGFLPKGYAAAEGAPWAQLPPALVLAAIALLVGLVPTVFLVGLAGAGFLWTTVLLNAPEAFRLRGRPSRQGAFQLPFHPLFPGLATAVSVFLPLALPPTVLLVELAWLLLGGIYFLAYARRHGISVREEQAVLRRAEPLEPESDYSVVAAVTDPYTAVPLIQAGARLARARGGRLLVLQALALSPHLPEKFKRFQAQDQLETLEGHLQRAGIEEGLPVVPFVRVAGDVVAGIVETVREERADLLLLAWEEARRRQVMDRVWERLSGGPAEQADEEQPCQPETCELTPLLDRVVRLVSCEVAVLRGQLPQRVERVLVPSGGGTHVAPVIRLGQALAATDRGQVSALHVTSGEAAPATFLPLDDAAGVEQRVVQADSVKSGILKEASLYDVVLVAASRPDLLQEALFGGIPVEVAQARRQPTLLVRPARRASWLVVQRAWTALTNIFSALSDEDRAAVSAQMREAARPSINFFVLITLAATIATLGLLQDSAAVIIGAMLVAPLMSPIASMAMGIVEGDAPLMRVAAEAIVKGIGLAISVAVAITLLAPEPQGLGQILARTQPTLLDLVVALASGAAAGYALSRKEVGAALPGVAIAVALVPPLCVVGFGLASADWGIAGGALLLFSTNVIAIILAAVAVFLILGFRPLPAQQEQFRRGLVVTLVSLLLVAIPLAVLLNVSLGQRQRAGHLRAAERVIDEALPDDTAQLVGVSLEPGEEGHLVRATIYNLADFDADDVAHLEELLSVELEAPVTLQAIVLDARQVGGGE